VARPRCNRRPVHVTGHPSKRAPEESVCVCVCVCVCVRKGMFDGWGGVTHRDAIGRLALLLVLRDLLTKHCGKGGVRVLANLRAWV
jgi:hypothetical protein